MLTRTCTHCGAENRIPPRHLASRGKCGKCKLELAPLDVPIDCTREQFDSIIREARVPVLVDFWAAWCAPCRMVAPDVRRLASEEAGRLIVLKVDTERYPELGARYGVRGIPNFVVFLSGRVAAQQAGAMRAEQLRAWVLRAQERTASLDL